MRIMFIGKRHPQQRDLIERPYGRFYHLPTALAARGHDVRVVLCSHRRLPALDLKRAGVTWSSQDIRTLGSRLAGPVNTRSAENLEFAQRFTDTHHETFRRLAE